MVEPTSCAAFDLKHKLACILTRHTSNQTESALYRINKFYHISMLTIFIYYVHRSFSSYQR